MPTLPSTETALVKAFAFDSARWSISGSPTCHPTLKTGFRDVIGSWKIIAIDSPRIPCISDSLSFVRSVPSYMTRPPTTRPGGGISRIRLSAVTDLPLPDSPTMPSVSPALSSNETPSTAFTTPSGVENCVAKKVGGQDREEDHHPRPDHQPARVEKERLGVGEHVAPAWYRRVDAKAEEVKCRFDEDDRTQVEASENDQHVQHVGQEVADDQANVAGAKGTGGHHEVTRAHRQHLAADESRDASPADRGDDQRESDCVGLEQDRHEDEKEDRRDGENDVDEAHEDAVDQPSVVAGHQPNCRADRQRHADGEEADAHRNLCSEEQTRELVAAEVVCAQNVAGTQWPGERVRKVLGAVVGVRDEARE